MQSHTVAQLYEVLQDVDIVAHHLTRSTSLLSKLEMLNLTPTPLSPLHDLYPP